MKKKIFFFIGLLVFIAGFGFIYQTVTEHNAKEEEKRVLALKEKENKQKKKR
ncbi:hypothetical protein MFLO_08777 [Listeria floridensis FSL S10-1187]|uniref:Uncharacterized protein n=1 Tax=Listeria floridensis FSL S10-1187 TaxID=1265817 RepID=A0ABN0RES4_9LIST|nr:hypothetical protein [Listeria floridensis]EUJ31511.1 hypothetical protein MFLO_08777 [Listeria floridensis FSL S10-1187]